MSRKIKNPIFAHGTESAIQSLISSHEITYPAYLWYTDKNTYNFLDKEGNIECIDFPKLTGTLDDKVILSELGNGIFYIKGQYKITASDQTVYSAGSYIIVIVDGPKIRRITADEIETCTIQSGAITARDTVVTAQYLEDNGYATEDYVDTAIEAAEATLMADVKDYIDETLPDMIESQIDAQITSIDDNDIEELFNET